jgi:predicted ATP-binding protein involved in virulence
LIPLDKLSSGEQHQLVLFHSLIFRMRPGALIMIDEPEISLHVGWQEIFLRDLEVISKSSGVHFLIATHSPTLIGNRWKQTVSLGEQIQEVV